MKDRWWIVRATTMCGRGRWAWIRNGRMQGCVCHHPMTLLIRFNWTPTKEES